MMKSLQDTYPLLSGIKIPCIGFGTWQTPNDGSGEEAVRAALACGYRHIDTAQGYGNEETVGRAVRGSGIPRGDVFITTKLKTSEHGYDKTIKAFEGSLASLGMDYVDLFLIHWPNPIRFRENWQETNAETWRAFEDLQKAGKVRSIGVSNFMRRHLDPLLKTASVKPDVNQIRLCPGDTQDDAVAASREHGILLEAYSPLGIGKVFSVPEVAQMALKYGVSVAQLCIRWSLERGYLPLPKSTHAERIAQNADVFGFTMTKEDIDCIANLTGCAGLATNPDEITW